MPCRAGKWEKMDVSDKENRQEGKTARRSCLQIASGCVISLSPHHGVRTSCRAQGAVLLCMWEPQALHRGCHWRWDWQIHRVSFICSFFFQEPFKPDSSGLSLSSPLAFCARNCTVYRLAQDCKYSVRSEVEVADLLT